MTTKREPTAEHREAAQQYCNHWGPGAYFQERAVADLAQLLVEREAAAERRGEVRGLGRALELMPRANHYGHFDREGNAGRTCPECINQRQQLDAVEAARRELETTNE